MIIKFRHKGLERYYLRGDGRGLGSRDAAKIRLILALLSVCRNPAMVNAPGLKLHPLKGTRKGQWAVSVSGNWRIVFEFSGEDVTNVDLVDYH